MIEYLRLDYKGTGFKSNEGFAIIEFPYPEETKIMHPFEVPNILMDNPAPYTNTGISGSSKTIIPEYYLSEGISLPQGTQLTIYDQAGKPIQQYVLEIKSSNKIEIPDRLTQKIRISKHCVRKYRYYEQESGFEVHLCELLKEPSRVEQLVKEGYVVFNYYLDRVDRAPDIEFLKALQDHFLELEPKGELYTTGDPDPYMLFLYQPGVTSKLLAKSSIKVQAVLGPHTIRYEVSRAYVNVIYCDTNFIGPEEKEYLIGRYGAPTCTKESRGEQYGPGGYIIIPVEDVDKLVAVERFRALDYTDEKPIYTGEERIYELDLRAPEESVYKYFLKREIIIEYDPENFASEYLYPPLEEEDTEKQRSKGQYLPAWLRFLWRKVSMLFRVEE